MLWLIKPWFKNKRNKVTLLGGLCFLVILVFSVFLLMHDNDPLTLFVNGQPVALVAGEEQVKEAIKKVERELSRKHGVTVSGCYDALSCQQQKMRDDTLTDYGDKLDEVLKSKLNWKAACWAITVNGQKVLFLPHEQAAKDALENLQKTYLQEEQNEYLLDSICFIENVEILAAEARIMDLVAMDQAVEMLAKGKDKIEDYTVKKGDTLWLIARDNNLSLNELREANPQQKGDMLKIGQKLALKKSEPLLNINYTMTMTLQESIPYKTSYISNPEMYRHQQQVEQEGAYGSRLVTYQVTKNNGMETQRITLAQDIISQPVERIVIRGTKNMVVSSRGGQFSGDFEWPLRGPITSKYGYRTLRGKREFHSGLDINGVTGDPVGAAQKGTVTFAGWCGNLGNTIAIDHGWGTVTRYCHLSSFNVKEGQNVERGELIGKVGSTGRSTGSHLHFEVWEDGQPQNPLNHLGR